MSDCKIPKQRARDEMGGFLEAECEINEVFPDEEKSEVKPDNVENVEIAGLDKKDYPKFCDAYFEKATFKDTGIELDDNELDELAEKFPDYLYECINHQLY